ncbi:MAG: RNA-binding cell elongation regulator Jag/EloR [Actinomycetota bacterium]
MAREVERTAATVDEAVADALEWLGADAGDVDVEVLREPAPESDEPGAAIVRVRLRQEEDDETPEPPSTPGTSADVATGLDELEEQADAVADFVDELLAKMDIDAIAEPNPQGGHMYVDIVDGPEEDMALLIGRHGQTLEAIQELARMAIGRRLDQRIRVIVDVEDYRKRRESRLEEDAREAALRVAAEGGEYEFDPMNAYERKLVHDAVAGVDGVETVSRGEEPSRYVVIRPV